MVTIASTAEIDRSTKGSASAAPGTTSRDRAAGRNAASQATTVNIRVARARAVSVMVDDEFTRVASAAPTVRELLLEVGLTVREGDLVKPALDTPLAGVATVTLAKAQRIAVTVDGQEQTLYTRAETVNDVLQVLGIRLGPEDVVTPALSTPVSSSTATAQARR